MTDETTSGLFIPAVEPAANANGDRGEPRGRCFAFAGSELLVIQSEMGASSVPSWAHLREWRIATVRHQYLGLLDEEPCWSAEIAEDAELPDGAVLTGLRALYEQVSETHYAVAGRAIQIIAWERDHQFCGRCGTPTERVPGERARRCPRCGLIAYPRLSPAIIVLIERGDSILLARGHAFAQGRFGIIAGFVEPGESLEDAVRREVREEVGIELERVTYFGSQPWPFPHGIMIGFRAHHHSGEITIDETELAEAGWYGIDALPTVPAKLSIARRLIDAWASERGAVIDQP
jgi:NAD+ diphosphatase